MSPATANTVIIIAGPTAVGKTDLAVSLAQTLQTEIISADSRQCYRELSIGVARPSETALAAVPHHFIASHSIHETVNAGVFEQYALDKTRQLFQQHQHVVMVGGTGLYIRAFCEGMDDMPDIAPAVREQIISQYETHGLVWLQEQLKTRDPGFWVQAEQQNPQRLMRALEVLESSGQSITRFRKAAAVSRPFNIITVGLELERQSLYERINQRVLQMMQTGLLEEVKALYPFKHLNALQTVGYSELMDFLDGKTTLDRSVQLIQQNTRHYAKRQMTWFKKNSSIHWLNAASVSVADITALLH